LSIGLFVAEFQIKISPGFGQFARLFGPSALPLNDGIELFRLLRGRTFGYRVGILQSGSRRANLEKMSVKGFVRWIVSLLTESFLCLWFRRLSSSDSLALKLVLRWPKRGTALILDLFTLLGLGGGMGYSISGVSNCGL
jgi:hypothetical protein